METGIKPRRSVLKRQKKDAAKLAKAQGATTAKLIDVPTSTRKMRLVADLIRGKKVNEALPILKFQAKQGARRLEKLLLAAVSDWTNKNSSVNIEDADLYVKTIFVDGGTVMKRMRPAPQGRGYRVRKRSNHVTMVLDSLISPELLVKKVVEEPKKEEKADKKTKVTAEKKETKKSTKKTDK
ncbi:MAG TPA: 50S ribosomal protein L22 [Cytophagaceae bacterium]|jgi:large subunit ribosomal protein L22|nr:50S ribosomal protein L22 [Cytophagaceae bacterium]